MKFLYFCSIVAALLLAGCKGTPKKAADSKYVISRSATSGKCVVQVSTASTLGTSIDGIQYPTRGTAVTAMCKLYVPASEDQDKCSDIDPPDACK